MLQSTTETVCYNSNIQWLLVPIDQIVIYHNQKFGSSILITDKLYLTQFLGWYRLSVSLWDYSS